MAKPPLFHKKPRKPEGLVLAFFAGDLTWDETTSAPETAWSAILALSERKLTPRQIAVLAAGPLEELLANRGTQFIARVEERSRQYPRFRHLLGGVWQNSTAQTVWDRVVACRGTAW